MFEHGSLSPNEEIQLFLLVGILFQSNGALLDFTSLDILKELNNQHKSK